MLKVGDYYRYKRNKTVIVFIKAHEGNLYTLELINPNDRDILASGEYYGDSKIIEQLMFEVEYLGNKDNEKVIRTLYGCK